MNVFRLNERRPETAFDGGDVAEILQRYGDDYNPRNGKSLIDSWEPIEIRSMGKKPRKGWLILPGDGGLFVLTPAGLNVFQHELCPYGEFLEARYGEDTVWLFHCTSVIDAVDHEKSVYELGYLDGPFIDMRHVEFDESQLTEGLLFGLSTYVSGLLVACNDEPPAYFQELADCMPGVWVEKVWPVE